MYIHGTKLGTPTAHRSASCIQGYLSVPNMGDIGRRAAHVQYDRILCAGQELPADHAGSRSGKHGFDRPVKRKAALHQAAVTLDDHHRDTVQPKFAQHRFHRPDQLGDAGDQPRVKRRRYRAVVEPKRLAQLMRTDDRQMQLFLHGRLDRQLVRRVPHARKAGYRDRVHLAAQLLYRLTHLLHIQRDTLPPFDIQLALQRYADCGRQFLWNAPSHQQQADTPAMPLDYSVGCQCGRKADHGGLIYLLLRQFADTSSDANA